MVSFNHKEVFLEASRCDTHRPQRESGFHAAPKVKEELRISRASGAATHCVSLCNGHWGEELKVEMGWWWVCAKTGGRAGVTVLSICLGTFSFCRLI